MYSHKKNIPINVTEENPETFFKLKNHKKAIVIISNAMWSLQMNIWKTRIPTVDGGDYPATVVTVKKS